jgi:large subunit ribosomal protein L6
MSNLAKQAVKIPSGISIKRIKNLLLIKGPLGQKTISLLVDVVLTEKNLFVTENLLSQYEKDKFKLNLKALRGTTIALIKQTFIGLKSGFRIQLKLVGVGFKVTLEELQDGSFLILKLGYSHSIAIKIPSNLKVVCLKNTSISILGSDKQKVNNFAAIIRSYKKPEPYKGKGILYHDEKIVLKEGKRS